MVQVVVGMVRTVSMLPPPVALLAVGLGQLAVPRASKALAVRHFPDKTAQREQRSLVALVARVKPAAVSVSILTRAAVAVVVA